MGRNNKFPMKKNPPRRPPCNHEYTYSTEYEKLKDIYQIVRICDECGKRDTKRIDDKTAKSENVEEWTEEDILQYFTN